jgi:bla regulator protein blaR1
VNVSELLAVGVSVVGWCLLHFVWQAAAVGMVYALMRGLLPRGNPRYVAAMLALLAMAVCPVLTAWHALSIGVAPQDLAGSVVTATLTAVSTAKATSASWRSMLDTSLPWLVAAWAAGVCVLGLRVGRQWLGLRMLLRAAEELPEWQARASHFANRLGLRRMVPVLASVRVATPTLVGWLRPAVVLPLAVLTRMPAAQIDLVLAHELSHLKRFDHVANLFQVVLETLFFYHPVVYWISREARNERELCCDALALRITSGERRDFVAALASLEEFRAGHGDLALAASGGVLVERAWFIAGATPERRQRHRHLRGNALLALMVAVVLGIGWFGWRAVAWQRQVAMLVAANNTSLLGDLRRDVIEPLVLVPEGGIKPTRYLPSLSFAIKPTPSVDVPVRLTPIHVPSIAKPGLKLGDMGLKLLPITITRFQHGAKVAKATAENRPVPAKPVHTVRPVYPPKALQDGLQGQVVVEFALDSAGIPRNLKVVASSASQFDASALQAMAGWRFAPSAVAGRRYRQTFMFRLDAGLAGGAAVAQSCLMTTGTHICRRAFAPEPGLQVLQAQH